MVDRTVKAAIPTSEPAMSIAYARSGGIDRRSGPRGSATAAISNVVKTTTSGRTTKLTPGRLLVRVEAEHHLAARVDLNVQLGVRDQHHHGEQQDRERRGGQVHEASPEKDADADPEEARNEEEVREEPDVADVRRNPTDQQQFREEDRGTNEQQLDVGPVQNRQRSDDLSLGAYQRFLRERLGT